MYYPENFVAPAAIRIFPLGFLSLIFHGIHPGEEGRPIIIHPLQELSVSHLSPPRTAHTIINIKISRLFNLQKLRGVIKSLLSFSLIYLAIGRPR